MDRYLYKLRLVIICLVMLVAGCQGTPDHDELDESVTVIPANGPAVWEENDDPTPIPALPDSPLSPPGQADSPLASPATPIPAHLQDLVQYRGFSVYGETYPPFEVWYDPENWEFHENYNGRNYTLVHRHISGCELWLQALAGGAQRIATAQLAGREWGIFEFRPTILSYSIPYENVAFLFDLTLPEAYSPDAKSPCQKAAEAVIDTFSIVTEASYDPETVPDSPLSPPIDGSGESSSTTSLTPADLQPFVKYRGFNAYGEEYPQFEVWYDPESWELILPYAREYTLVHRHIPDCELLLQEGPRQYGSEGSIGPRQLAGRTWSTGGGVYSTVYVNLAFIFRVSVPEWSSPYAPNPCREEIEAVIDTFSVVAEASYDPRTVPDRPLDGGILYVTRPLDRPASDFEVWAWRDGRSTFLHSLGEVNFTGPSRFSPDQAYFAYVQDNELWIASLDGSETRALVTAADLANLADESGWPLTVRQLAWTSHGDGLVFTTAPAESWTPSDDLHHVALDTGQVTIILPAGRGGDLYVSPDGRMFATVSPQQFHLLDGETLAITQMLDYTGTPIDDYTGRVTPNIVFGAQQEALAIVLPSYLGYGTLGLACHSLTPI